MERIALFPGTFDPLTLGHIDVVNRSLAIFDRVVVGIGTNTYKPNMLFSTKQRLAWIEKNYASEERVKCIIYEGLTVECCRTIGAKFIIRGIRYVSDFEYEKSIADMNHSLDQNIETIYLTCRPLYSSVASTLVRDVYRNGGDASAFLPQAVKEDIYPNKK